MATMTIHAPSTNLVVMTTTVTMKVASAPDAVHERACLPAPLARRVPVAHHSRLREREGGEDADHVQVDEPVDVGPEGDDERGSKAGEDDDSVPVDERVPRFENWRGKKPSRARRAPRRGKPW